MSIVLVNITPLLNTLRQENIEAQVMHGLAHTQDWQTYPRTFSSPRTLSSTGPILFKENASTCIRSLLRYPYLHNGEASSTLDHIYILTHFTLRV